MFYFVYYLSLQPYIIDATLSENSLYGGFEHSGIPDGIPQLEEYLAVYCSMSVSIVLLLFSCWDKTPILFTGFYHSLSSFKFPSGTTLACSKLEVLHCLFTVSRGIYLCRSIPQMDYGTSL